MKAPIRSAMAESISQALQQNQRKTTMRCAQELQFLSEMVNKGLMAEQEITRTILSEKAQVALNRIQVDLAKPVVEPEAQAADAAAGEKKADESTAGDAAAGTTGGNDAAPQTAG